jgi:hypothetical protein
MTVAARAIQDSDQSARHPDGGLNRAAYISRWIRALGTNKLSSGEYDGEDNGGPLQSCAHGSSLESPKIREGGPGFTHHRSHEKVLTSTASRERDHLTPHANAERSTMRENCCRDKMATESRNCRTNEDNLAVAGWVKSAWTNDRQQRLAFMHRVQVEYHRHFV